MIGSHRRRMVLYALVMLGLLTGCTSADPAQARITNPQRPNSVNATLGSIRLLATRIESPADAVHTAGGNVGLFTTLANDGQTGARLLGVSTVYANSVVQRNGLEGPVTAVDVAIPAGGVASMQYPGGPHLELVGLKTDVTGGRFVPVTFRFGTGSLTVDVFVEGFAQPTVSPPSSSP